LSIEHATESERTHPERKYKLVCQAYDYRLRQTFTFSIAIAIRQESRGFNFALSKDGRIVDWWRLRSIEKKLIGDNTIWEIVSC
jgi:hypothetical protein